MTCASCAARSEKKLNKLDGVTTTVNGPGACLTNRAQAVTAASRPSEGRAGRVGDVSGHLNPGGQQFRGDRGAAEPEVTVALAVYQAGQGSEQAALTALAASRLLVPVIAVLADGAATDGAATDGTALKGDKDSEMVLPTLIGRDGRPAVLAFTSVDALARWRPNARPVPAEADRVWRAAVADGCAVVIDVAGPVPLAVEGARLAALAAGQPVPPPHEDPDVRAEVQAAVAAEPAIAGFTLAPAREGHNGREGHEAREDHKGRTGREDHQHGPDLAITLHLAENEPAQEKAQAVNRAAAHIAARLGTRLRRGIEVIVAG
jgi:SseB protein N-terminal domain